MDAATSNCSPDSPDPLGKAAHSSDGPMKSQLNRPKLTTRGRKRVSGMTVAHAPHCSSSSCSSSSSTIPASNFSRGLRIAKRQRNPSFLVRNRASDVESMAFPLGMSIAAVVAQVLERTDATCEKVPVDYLSKICTSAVRESLANVFGNKFEPFARNFETSFESTLNTLILVKGSSRGCLQDHLSCASSKNNCLEMTPAEVECSSRNSDAIDCQTESTLPTIFTAEKSSDVEEIRQNQLKVCITRELSLHNTEHPQLSCVSSNLQSFSNSGSMLSIYEKSISEQARSNDLKAFEISLAMKKLQLKESQLALNSDSNFLERCKLSMGVSKASFKAEKFKTQMEDTRHTELLRNCIDCLVAGLLIMSSLIAYGAYVFSYKRITQETSSCASSMESKAWWVPKPMASFSSGLQTLKCQVQVISRMLFGFLMILAIAYLMIQRSATPRQTMPLTFILLLLGFGCGVVGKFCIDTLGGSGYHWVIYWEVLCLLHFFANMFTSVFFLLLYGPIKVSQSTKPSVIFPYWLRRALFYLVALLILPLLTGLLPFASLGEWNDHFSALISNLLLVAIEED